VEPIQNIALARNRALSAATSDHIVFVDDDEYVAEDWLENLIHTAETEKADVVFGPVIAVYPSNTPNWILRGGFFDRPRHPTGTQMPTGASGNTLIKSSSLGLLDSHFDSSYGLTGGEDAEFFSRLYKQGARMVWCDNALAYEHVPCDRMRISWLLGRSFRGGQGYWRIIVSKQSILQKIVWFFSRLVCLLVSLLLTPIWLITGKSHGIKMLRHGAIYAGQLSGVLGIYQKGY
jgi:succinoglycan biosynthesis protein ExoM